MDSSPRRPNPLVEFFAVPFRLRTYGSLLYVWLAFPLGLAYFVGLTVGFAAGIPLTIVWIGLLILLGTLLAAWGAAGLERQLAMHLLGASVPTRQLRTPPATPLGRLGATLSSKALWKGMLFLALKFPIGLIGWIGSVVGLSVSLAFLATPILVALHHPEIRLDLGYFTPTTPLEALPLALAGLLGLLLTLHLQNALGWLWARLAELLLGAELPKRSQPLAPAPIPA